MRTLPASRWFRLLLLVAMAVGAVLASASSHAAAQDDAEVPSTFDGEVLRVATKPLEPFVFVDDQPLRGFSVDYWNEVAARIGATTEWVEYETVAEIIEAVENGDADVAIAGISITAQREQIIDFSQPYYNSGLKIVTQDSSTGTFRALFSLIGSGTFIVPLLFLIGLILIVSHLVWFVERGHGSDDFPTEYRKGIVEALWWSTVSVITGGEAVKDINRGLSRVVAIFWMLIGLFLLAVVTARATSVLTVAELQSDISSLDDLGGRKVGTVEGTSSVTFMRDEAGIVAREYVTLDDAFDALEDGNLDAVVFDAPVVSYAVATERDELRVVDNLIGRDPYGIAVGEGSELLEPLNAAVIQVGRDGTLDGLLTQWFGS